MDASLAVLRPKKRRRTPAGSSAPLDADCPASFAAAGAGPPFLGEGPADLSLVYFSGVPFFFPDL